MLYKNFNLQIENILTLYMIISISNSISKQYTIFYSVYLNAYINF